MARELKSVAMVLSICLAGLLMPSLSAAQASIESSDTELLQLLAPELADARLLTMSDLTQAEAGNIGDTPNIGRRLSDDFNSDGQPDLALFGSIPSGTFVLILSQGEAVWHRAGLLTFSRPFIIGGTYEGRLSVFYCTGCDSGGRVVWNGSGYEFVPFPPQGVVE